MRRGLIRYLVVRFSLAAAAALLIMPCNAIGQSYPQRPLRMIVPFAPGGGTDILARIAAGKLTESTGQQVIVDNRPGAGGNVGTELAARATPDGYTLLMVSASYAVNAVVYKLALDPVKDLSPVIQVASVPFVLLAHPSVPVSNIKELLALAKAQPGKLTYASSGTGSSPHLAGELLSMMTGTRMVHVPYKGGGPALRDLMGGQVQLLYVTVVAALPYIEAGKLKALGVASLHRSSALPAVATIAESGVPGYDVTNWFGLLVPAGTPASIVTLLNTEVRRQMNTPDAKARLASQGADPASGSPQDFGRLIREDIAKYQKIVQAAGITIR